MGALTLTPPRRLGVRGVQRQATAAAADGSAEGAADGSVRVRPTLRRSPRAAVPAGERNGALRTVVCGDAVAWLENRVELPCVVTSLPDVSELQGPPLYISSATQYKSWFRHTVATIVSKLSPGSVAVFAQTDTARDGEFISKAALCFSGAEDAGGKPLWHKIALRREVGLIGFGKMPAYTHWLAFASPKGGLVRAKVGTVGFPDVLHRGDVVWSKAMGVDAAVWTARFLRHDIGATEVCDPFCGSGTMLAAANFLGLDALGVELSAKRARHAMLMQLFRTEDGQLIARRSSDRAPSEDGDAEGGTDV